MMAFNRISALFLASALCATSLMAQTTPAPPNWQDGQGASVYLQATQQPQANPPAAASERYVAERPAAELATPAAIPMPAAPQRIDAAVTPANHVEPVASPPTAERRLAPPTSRNNETSATGERSPAAAMRSVSFGIPTQAIYTVITGLAIVIGAFLIFAWALRRSGKNSNHRRGALPSEVVSVLGRAPLAARQFAELLRVGNKLVLVAMTPTGPTTITEVTDPVEVDRLVGMCQQFEPHSTTKAFEQVFQQFSSEPTSGGFLGGEPLPAALSSAASAYRSHRGSSRA